MDDDFNTPAAIAILFEMTREINNLKKDEEIEKANNLGSELKNAFTEPWDITKKSRRLF